MTENLARRTAKGASYSVSQQASSISVRQSSSHHAVGASSEEPLDVEAGSQIDENGTRKQQSIHYYHPGHAPHAIHASKRHTGDMTSGFVSHILRFLSKENKKTSSSRFVVPILVLVWYSMAVFAITTSKKIMMRLPLPYLLCACQFLAASIATSAFSYYSNQAAAAEGPSPSSSSRLDDSSNGSSSNSISSSSSNTSSSSSSSDDEGDSMRQVQHVHASPLASIASPFKSKFHTTIWQISISYTLGFVFTNMAFSIVSASFAETVKSAEPISSVLLSYFILRESTTLPTYLTLIPICAGVGISCLHDDGFDIWGFIYALSSNFFFSSRAVLAKSLFKHFPGSIDETQLFGQISIIGLLLLVPLTIFAEGSAIFSALFTNPGTNFYSSLELLVLLFFNGCAYSCYNLVSFLVLSRTNLVTHAVLNCFRRVFIILFTSFYFLQPISMFNLGGVALAVTGVLLFAYCRSRESRSGVERNK